MGEVRGCIESETEEDGGEDAERDEVAKLLSVSACYNLAGMVLHRC